MENKDFRRRLLDQELPVDAGAFGRVMERRKAGGSGAAWIGKGIWAAALLVATAGIAMFVQRKQETASAAESAGTQLAIAAESDVQPAKPGNQTQATYRGAVALKPNRQTQAEQADMDRAQDRIGTAGNNGTKRNKHTATYSTLEKASRNGGGVKSGDGGDAGIRTVSPVVPSEQDIRIAADWTALMKRPLRIHPIVRTPAKALSLERERTAGNSTRLLQTEWMVEPGWVHKQSPSGATLRRQERFAGSAAFTARVVIPVNQGFQWLSGLRYQEWVDHFNFSQEHTATHQRIDAYDVIIRIPGQADRIETRYDTSQIQVTRQESYSDVNRYRMIGLPLAMRWSPADQGMWYVQAGLTPSYLVYSGGSRRLSDGRVVSLSDNAALNRFQLQAAVAAGMRTFIAPRIAFLLEPGLGYNLTPFAPAPMRQRNLQLSLSAGLMLHLGR